MGGAFCPVCGSILPLPSNLGKSVQCYCCKTEHSLTVYGDMETSYTIPFNSIVSSAEKTNGLVSKPQADGPVIRRKCPKCGNSKMSYATLQLRSADEGQTVFYTCTKCRFKESENS